MKLVLEDYPLFLNSMNEELTPTIRIQTLPIPQRFGFRPMNPTTESPDDVSLESDDIKTLACDQGDPAGPGSDMTRPLSPTISLDS